VVVVTVVVFVDDVMRVDVRLLVEYVDEDADVAVVDPREVEVA